jgi:alpha-L-rhamnosidase
MNSFNHYTWGSIGQFLYEYVAGLRPDPGHPGFVAAQVRPHLGGALRWATASYESVVGRYSVGWRLDGDRFQMDIEVPANARASITLPWTRHFVVDGSGRSIDPGSRGVARVGSGRWQVTAELPSLPDP